MDNDQRLTTAVSSVLMVATLVLGWFTLSDRWSVQRLAVGQSLGGATATEQNIPARLWEDPLQAVAMEVGKGRVETNHPREEFQQFVLQKQAKTNQVLLLVVPIPGTPFPDDVETRLRLRYSIQMALADQHCTPEDRNHLGYVSLPWAASNGVHSPAPPTQRQDGRASGEVVQLPYEWFASRIVTNLKVLVVWLPEELLGSEPLCRLAYLRQQLFSTNSASFLGPFVIGPRASDTLKAMATSGLAKTNHTCIELLRTKLCIFSPQATAPDALIGLIPNPRWTEARKDMDRRLREQLSEAGETNWVYFESFIAPDDQLTDLLVQELDLRRVALKGKQPDRVLLLAEADTSYGRSLPLAFQASVESFRAGRIWAGYSGTSTNISEDTSRAPEANSGLVVARYLCGLDARKGFQGEETATQERSRSTEQLLAEALNRKSAVAFGESQLDYAERLAEQLARDATQNQIKAVGILGGDLYDKLILLRSLRLRFREALFFTTDLDARLWHPEHDKFTRNLVVASAHSLYFNTNRAGYRIPPFRDVYQVAVFNACSAAIARASGATNRHDIPAPALYEVGRHGPMKLALASPSSPWWQSLLRSPQNWGLFFIPFAVAAWTVARQRCRILRAAPIQWRNLFAERTGWVGWFCVSTTLVFLTYAIATGNWTCAWLMVFNASLWLLLCLRQMHDLHRDHLFAEFHFADLFRKRTGKAGWFALGTLLILIFATALFEALGMRSGGEPWSWSEGVSIWPTELIRLAIIASVIWMLVWARQRHQRHSRRLTIEFMFRTERQQWRAKSLSNRSLLARVFEPWPEPCRTAGDETCATTIEAVTVFQCYRAKATPIARWIRASLGASVYFLFGFSVVLMHGMPASFHIRGNLAFVLDLVILFTSIFGWLALVFYVLDAVYLSSQLLTRIAEPFTQWPQELLTRNAGQFRVNRALLEGYLDVQFAAQHTRETGKLVLLPFLIQFLMLVARNSYFDNWSWPTGLLLIFTGNMVLSTAAWVILRRAAARLKRAALVELEKNLRTLETQIASESNSHPEAKTHAEAKTEAKLGTATELKASPQSQAETAGHFDPPPKVQKLGLEEIRRRIEGEQRGAYARWFQDPAFLAVLLPTGLFGILSLLFQALFGLM